MEEKTKHILVYILITSIGIILLAIVLLSVDISGVDNRQPETETPQEVVGIITDTTDFIGPQYSPEKIKQMRQLNNQRVEIYELKDIE